MSKEETVISIPEAEYKVVEHYARQRGMTAKQFYELAIQEALKAWKENPELLSIQLNRLGQKAKKKKLSIMAFLDKIYEDECERLGL